MTKKRFMYLIISLALLLVEIWIALFVHDQFVRPYVGDFLVVIVLYSIVRTCFPEGIKLLSFYIFLFAVFVEVLQYFEIVKILNVEHNVILCIILGSSFDVRDIFCYGLGCSSIYIISKVADRLIFGSVK